MRNGRKRKKDFGGGGFVKTVMQTITFEWCKQFYPKRNRNSHKGTYGSANIIAGSDKYPGAAVLALESALMSGCGYVKLTSSEKVKYALAVKFPQAIYLEEPDLNSQCIAVGMGMGVSQELYDKIKYLLTNYQGTLLIDADGLNSLSKFGTDILKQKTCTVILTPHLKEFSRLTGKSVQEISKAPQNLAEEFAIKLGVIVLLKGADSFITDGENTFLNNSGTTALAKGGSGDMLSGFICGTVARGVEPLHAVCCSAYTMGLSAEISSAQKTDYCATARDVIKNLHIAVKQLTE